MMFFKAPARAWLAFARYTYESSLDQTAVPYRWRGWRGGGVQADSAHGARKHHHAKSQEQNKTTSRSTRRKITERSGNHADHLGQRGAQHAYLHGSADFYTGFEAVRASTFRACSWQQPERSQAPLSAL